MSIVEDPDNPTNGNPDAVVIAGERIEPDDVDVNEDVEEEEETVSAESQQDEVDYKKRFGDATKYAQQEKARAESLQARLTRLEKNGINLAEIEALLPQEGQQTISNPDIVTKADLARVTNGIQFMMSRSQFISGNPEFKDSNLAELLDMNIVKLINTDRSQGLPPRNPDELYRSAAKNVKTLINTFENKGKKKVTEQRQKVKTQSADMGGDSGKRKSSDAEEKPYDPRSSYVNSQANAQRI
jgi:hypothetical protein